MILRKLEKYIDELQRMVNNKTLIKGKLHDRHVKTIQIRIEMARFGLKTNPNASKDTLEQWLRNLKADCDSFISYVYPYGSAYFSDELWALFCFNFTEIIQINSKYKYL